MNEVCLSVLSDCSFCTWLPGSPVLLLTFRVVEGRAGLGHDRSFPHVDLGPMHLKALSLFVTCQGREGECLMGKGINVGWEHSCFGGIRTMVADKQSSRDLQNLLQGRKWSGKEGKEIIKPHEEM